MRIVLRGVVVWCGIIVVEVFHGIARTLFLAPLVGDFRARQIAVFTGSILILIVATVVHRLDRPGPRRLTAVAVGAVWLVLTLAFEIAFGRYVVRAPWSRIASDYDLLRGGLLPIGLAVLTVAPLVCGQDATPAVRAGRRSRGPRDPARSRRDTVFRAIEVVPRRKSVHNSAHPFRGRSSQGDDVAKKAKKSTRKPSAAFMKPMTPSAALGEVVGTKPLPRTEVTKKLWGYIKKNGLQDKKNKRMIKADDSPEGRVRRKGHREHVRDDEAREQALEVSHSAAVADEARWR